MTPLTLHSSQIYFEIPSQITLEGSVLIITDSNVAPLHLQALKAKLKAKEVFELILSSGEESKTLFTLEKILHFALQCKLDRKSTMIALGGGVISDLTGLASALFMRGIDFINIPTTLLAQVDASVGGKCGVNTHFGKNLIGVFKHPQKVFISSNFLTTLPPRDFSAGMAEVIKMAICFNPKLFALLFDKANLNLDEIIYQSILIKAKVVQEDEIEQGIRSALNYGHTFGHVIEKDGNYQTYLHGEAVALGMVMSNTMASKLLGFQSCDEIKDLLKLYNLPISYTIKDKEAFYQSLFLDKKTQNKQIKFILPQEIGRFCFIHPQKEEIMDTLREYQ